MSKGKYKRRKAAKQPQVSALLPQEEPPHSQPAIALPVSSEKWYLQIPKKLWQGVVVVGVILGVLGGIYTFFPKISVSPASTLNPSDPFKTPFVLENESPLAIYAVHYSVIVGAIRYPNDLSWKNAKYSYWWSDIPVLSSHRKATIKITAPIAVVNGTGSNTPPISGDVEISVEYRPKFYPTKCQERFRFHIEKTSSGELIWFPDAP